MLRNAIISLCVFSIASVSNCLAQTHIEGQVMSPTPCHLQLKDPARACMQVTVGVPGKLSVRGGKKGSNVAVSVDEFGNFSAKFPKAGRYRVSFKRASGDSRSLSISPRVITVKGAGQAELFVVAHKSYGKVPTAALSSGCIIR